MKTMLNLSLLLMITAGAIGSANFMSMYRTGEIDKIYDHHEKTVVAHTVVATPKAVAAPPAVKQEKIKAEPAGSVLVWAKEKEVAAVPEVVSIPEVVSKEEMEASEDVKPVTEEREKVTRAEINAAPETIVTDEASHRKVVEKKVGKKKFRLSMYSRAPLWEEVDETVSTDTAGIKN